jgi:hypothetical protein
VLLDVLVDVDVDVADLVLSARETETPLRCSCYQGKML